MARAVATATAVDMTERGVESLIRMSDREVVERARKVKGGEIFDKLYNGEKVFESDVKDERILMMRLGMFCEGDTERLVRVFQSSGQFRDDKPNSYYMQLAQNTMGILSHRVNEVKPKPKMGEFGKSHFGVNVKT